MERRVQQAVTPKIDFGVSFDLPAEPRTGFAKKKKPNQTVVVDLDNIVEVKTSPDQVKKSVSFKEPELSFLNQ